MTVIRDVLLAMRAEKSIIICVAALDQSQKMLLAYYVQDSGYSTGTESCQSTQVTIFSEVIFNNFDDKPGILQLRNLTSACK